MAVKHRTQQSVGADVVGTWRGEGVSICIMDPSLSTAAMNTSPSPSDNDEKHLFKDKSVIEFLEVDLMETTFPILWPNQYQSEDGKGNK